VSEQLLTDVSLLVLALLVGVEVIGKVPATLHTPLMSAANAIHGIVLVGTILVASTARGPVELVLAFLCVSFAAMNVVGGYAVTDRMLAMFGRRDDTPGARRAQGDRS
jgi:NAD(P) transhydrogenase subunit alpha